MSTDSKFYKSNKTGHICSEHSINRDNESKVSYDVHNARYFNHEKKYDSKSDTSNDAYPEKMVVYLYYIFERDSRLFLLGKYKDFGKKLSTICIVINRSIRLLQFSVRDGCKVDDLIDELRLIFDHYLYHCDNSLCKLKGPYSDDEIILKVYIWSEFDITTLKSEGKCYKMVYGKSLTLVDNFCLHFDFSSPEFYEIICTLSNKIVTDIPLFSCQSFENIRKVTEVNTPYPFNICLFLMEKHSLNGSDNIFSITCRIIRNICLESYESSSNSVEVKQRTLSFIVYNKIIQDSSSIKYCENEYEVLMKFSELLEENDIDILVSFDLHDDYLPFIRKKSLMYGNVFKIGRFYDIKDDEAVRIDESLEFVGRLYMSLWKLYEFINNMTFSSYDEISTFECNNGKELGEYMHVNIEYMLKNMDDKYIIHKFIKICNNNLMYMQSLVEKTKIFKIVFDISKYSCCCLIDIFRSDIKALFDAYFLHFLKRGSCVFLNKAVEKKSSIAKVTFSDLIKKKADYFEENYYWGYIETPFLLFDALMETNSSILSSLGLLDSLKKYVICSEVHELYTFKILVRVVERVLLNFRFENDDCQDLNLLIFHFISEVIDKINEMCSTCTFVVTKNEFVIGGEFKSREHAERIMSISIKRLNSQYKHFKLRLKCTANNAIVLHTNDVTFDIINGNIFAYNRYLAYKSESCWCPFFRKFIEKFYNVILKYKTEGNLIDEILNLLCEYEKTDFSETDLDDFMFTINISESMPIDAKKTIHSVISNKELDVIQQKTRYIIIRHGESNERSREFNIGVDFDRKNIDTQFYKDLIIDNTISFLQEVKPSHKDLILKIKQKYRPESIDFYLKCLRCNCYTSYSTIHKLKCDNCKSDIDSKYAVNSILFNLRKKIRLNTKAFPLQDHIFGEVTQFPLNDHAKVFDIRSHINELCAIFNNAEGSEHERQFKGEILRVLNEFHYKF